MLNVPNKWNYFAPICWLRNRPTRTARGDGRIGREKGLENKPKQIDTQHHDLLLIHQYHRWMDLVLLIVEEENMKPVTKS